MNGRVQRTLLFASLLPVALPVLVALPPAPAGAGGGCHSEQSPRPTEGTAVAMRQMCFVPGVLRVDPGATVRFTNDDSVTHVVLGAGWGSGEEIEPGATVEHRFPEPGTYAYSCPLHPSMNGAIVVGAADATAATAGDRAELASSSAASPSPSSTPDLDARHLALGSLTGAVAGSLVTGRWSRRRRSPQAG